MKLTRIFVLFFVLFFTLPVISQAMPMYQSQVMPLQTCQACHENVGGGGALNGFGKDFDQAGHVFKKIAKLDSDKDGFTNAQEISAKTLPGDADSNPNSGSPLMFVVIFILIIAAVIAVFIFLRFKKKSGQSNGQ